LLKLKLIHHGGGLEKVIPPYLHPLM